MTSSVGATPVVTVVMPVRNAARYLAEAIESILSQTFRDFELLIVDDGSTDETPKILAKFQARDRRVSVHRLPGGGLSAALNHGCSLARGSLIARMDGDDVALAERLERQVEFLAVRTDVVLLGTAHTEIDSEGSVLGMTVYPTDPEAVAARLPVKNCIAHPTVMFSRCAFESVGGYRRAFFPAEDYDLWLRLGDRYAMANLPEPLLQYRLHSGSASLNNRRQQVLSAIGAQAATRARRSGKDDPLTSAELVTPTVLYRIGVSRAEVARALFGVSCGEAERALAAGEDVLAARFCEEALAWGKDVPLDSRQRAHVHRIAAIAAMNQRRPVRAARAVAVGIAADPALILGVARRLTRGVGTLSRRARRGAARIRPGDWRAGA